MTVQNKTWGVCGRSVALWHTQVDQRYLWDTCWIFCYSSKEEVACLWAICGTLHTELDQKCLQSKTGCGMSLGYLCDFPCHCLKLYVGYVGHVCHVLNTTRWKIHVRNGCWMSMSQDRSNSQSSCCHFCAMLTHHANSSANICWSQPHWVYDSSNLYLRH